MESCGYRSIYVQRNGKKRDGCGIFYKPNRAELVLMEQICYNDLVNLVDREATREATTKVFCTKNKDALDDDDAECENRNSSVDLNDPRVRLKRDCVGILAAFKLNEPSQHLLVLANTHLYWDPELVDVKLAQAKYLCSRLVKFKSGVLDAYGSTPSVIVAGDFNSTPGDQVYEYLVSGNETTSLLGGQQQSPISLRSLYADNGGEPMFTNFTPNFVGTLDYIFLSHVPSFLKPVSLLCVPSGPHAADLAGGLPNHHHSSDHLPIGGDFQLNRSGHQVLSRNS